MREFFKEEKWQFLILLLVAGAFYLLLWRNEAPQIAGDTKEYREAAADLVKNWTYTDFHYRPPGLPMLIAITGATEKQPFSFFLFQMFFHIASVFILVTLALHLKFPRKYIYLFLALALFPPFVDSLTTAIMSESFAAFLLSVALFFFVKNNSIYSMLACGLFLSLASLVRPIYQLVFIPLGLMHFLFYRSFKHFAALTAGSLLFVGAYVVFNSSHFNVREVTLSGMNLSTRTSLVLERLPEDNPMREALLKCRDRQLLKYHSSHTAAMYIWGCRESLQEQFQISQPELGKRMKSINFYLIKSAPLNYLQTVLSDLVIIWFPYEVYVTEGYGRKYQLFYSAVSLATKLLFFIASVLYFSKKILLRPPFKPDDFLIYILSIFIWYTALLSVLVDYSNPRYLLPTESMIFLSTILMFVNLRQRQVTKIEKVEVRSAEVV